MNQFTFWHEFKRANGTVDRSKHVTLRFDSGFIYHKTKDAKRSVNDDWRAIGTYTGLHVPFFRFDVKVPHLWVACNVLSDKGARVHGEAAMYRLTGETYSKRTDTQTDPDTFLGQQRKRSLDLGHKAKGEGFGARTTGGKFNVHDMRAAILARK